MRIKNICFNCSQISRNNDEICPICNNRFIKVNIIDAIKLDNMSEESVLKWIESKTGYPIKNEELAKHQKYVNGVLQQYQCQKEQERINKQFEDYSAKLEHGRQILEEQKCVPKCPICNSANIKKISIGTRAVKTAAFGVYGAVDDAGKTYKCSKCGCKF